MRKRHEGGVWELFVPEIEPGTRYKFEIMGADRGHLPAAEGRPLRLRGRAPAGHRLGRARRSAAIPWRDDGVADAPARGRTARQAPISIYECHLGSWRACRRRATAISPIASWPTSSIPYVEDMGFTHIELLPITEYPFDGSWGYQPVGAVRADQPLRRARRISPASSSAATRPASASSSTGCRAISRPTRTASACFDGTHLYEHADPRQGFHQDWNTYIYNFGRREVATFLSPTRCFWLEQFHLDGLRVDAVASMLYLDYSRKAGEWVPNQLRRQREPRGHRLPAAHERARLRRAPGRRSPSPRNSTAWPGVSQPDLPRRPRLRLQVEHGLDARHARASSRRTRSTAATTTTT